MPDASSLNPFANINLGASTGSLGAIAVIIVIAVIIIGLIGFLIYWRSVKKAYWIKVHVFRLIGNVPTRVAIYDAREVPFGMAGDKLWKVAPSGMFKFKVIKWLPCGKIQTAPREFWYYIREDGEWINFSLKDLNEMQRLAGVRFVSEDMRLQRLATERLLEQRLMNKTFWEKYGTIIMTVIFFLVISVCMVIIFYQFGKIQDQQLENEKVQFETAKILLRVFGDNYINNALNSSGGSGSLIPA